MACRDQIEITVKRNAAVLRDHIDKMDKHMVSMFAEMRATIAAQKQQASGRQDVVEAEEVSLA